MEACGQVAAQDEGKKRDGDGKDRLHRVPSIVVKDSQAVPPPRPGRVRLPTVAPPGGFIASPLLHLSQVRKLEAFKHSSPPEFHAQPHPFHSRPRPARRLALA